MFGLAALVTLPPVVLQQWQDVIAIAGQAHCIINRKRASLSPDTMDCLIFLNDNWDVCCRRASCPPTVQPVLAGLHQHSNNLIYTGSLDLIACIRLGTMISQRYLVNR